MKIHQVIDKLSIEIQEKSQGLELFVVGISGLDASGKTQVAKLLSGQLVSNGVNVLTVSGDSFQYPREYKENLQETDWATQHIKRTINFEKMTQEFLVRLQQLPNNLSLDVVDYDTKEVIQKNITLSYPLVVIIESIYLFQKTLIPFIQYKIFLAISIPESLKRAQSRQRDLDLYGGPEGVKKKYSLKNYPGFIQFEKQENPKQYADTIIDNNDWENPVVSSGKF